MNNFLPTLHSTIKVKVKLKKNLDMFDYIVFKVVVLNNYTFNIIFRYYKKNCFMNLMDVFMVFRLNIILLDLLRQTLTLDGMEVVNHKATSHKNLISLIFMEVFFFFNI